MHVQAPLVRAVALMAIAPLSLAVPAAAQTQPSDAAATTAVVPQIVKYSGVDADRARDTVEAVFRIYANAEGGEPLWSETQRVTIDADGKYSVLLGAATEAGLPQSVFSAGQARWLGISIERGPEQPRVALASAPYAMKAADAETLAGVPAAEFVTQTQLRANAAEGGASESASGRMPGVTHPGSSPTGSGIAGAIPLWTKTSVLGDSLLSQKASTITAKGSIDASSATTAPALSGANTAKTGAVSGISGTAESTTANAAGVSGTETAKTGVVYGVNGTSESTTENSAGVNGTAKATTGAVYGVSGITSSTGAGSGGSAAGVSGYEGAKTGQVYGVLGVANSTTTGAAGIGGAEHAATGEVYGVSGSASSSTNFASGVFGYESATSGVVYGVFGGTASTTANAAAVNGSETAATGQVYGVSGYSASSTTNAAGINGYEGSTTGQVYGVNGASNSSSNYSSGVNGFNGSTTGVVYGVSGQSNSATNGAAAINGYEPAATGVVSGVYGTAESATLNAAGVFGYEGATTGQVWGVSGVTFSTGPNAAGVNGYEGATSSLVAGVRGSTGSTGTGAAGVFGWDLATTGVVYGLSGESDSAGNNAAAVYGIETATTGQVYGMNGNTNSTSANAAGVYGYEGAASGGVFGVNGSTTSTGPYAAGVTGYESATTGVNWGVNGTSNSTSGIGVQGSSPNIGVAAFTQSCSGSSCSPTAGTAGQFNTGQGGMILVGMSAPTGTTTPTYTEVFSVDASGDGTFAGNLNVTGKVTKGSGSFKIDDPLDPANKYLSHSFVESPDMMNVYNGNVVTDKHGMATVTLPGYFEALNRDFRYQLTVIGQFAQAIVAQEIEKNRFVIRTSKPGVKVSWQVTGIRQDAYANANRIPEEEDKPQSERGYYLHPEVFGMPASQSVAAARKPASPTSAPAVNSR